MQQTRVRMEHIFTLGVRHKLNYRVLIETWLLASDPFPRILSLIPMQCPRISFPNSALKRAATQQRLFLNAFRNHTTLELSFPYIHLLLPIRPERINNPTSTARLSSLSLFQLPPHSTDYPSRLARLRYRRRFHRQIHPCPVPSPPHLDTDLSGEDAPQRNDSG